MKVLLGMSGGVDSTLAAVRLAQLGYTVEGAVLKMHGYTETNEAIAAASSVGIPIHEIDCSVEFDRVVKEYFIDEYVAGRTPNPCIICNSEIKFRFLADYAKKHGFDKIATGHYASVVDIKGDDGNVYRAIAMGEDKRKDQSYMLWRLSEDILDMLLLPLANDVKSSVVEEAKNKGLAAAEREESQEICFIPDGDYASFIENARGEMSSGNFVDCEGRVLGAHRGIIRYTVGQRKGLGISTGERMFVHRIDPEKNEIVLSRTAKVATKVEIDSVRFSPALAVSEGQQIVCQVKVRYLAPLCDALIVPHSECEATVIFSSPTRFAAPGQSLVLYRDGAVVGGGRIISME